MLEVKIDIEALSSELGGIVRRLENPTPLMAGIANELLAEAEHQLKTESGPEGPWPDLAISTQEQRRKTKNWPGQMLQVSGSLASSIHGFHNSHEAGVRAGSGPSKEYAAIHQFGGKAGRGHKSTIKARPFLPIRGTPDNAFLSDQATDAVIETVRHYINGSDRQLGGDVTTDHLTAVINRLR